jgi:hypothetical protein
VPAVLAGIERPVLRHPVDRDQRAVQHDMGDLVFCGFAQGLAQPGGPGGQQGNGLVSRTSRPWPC